MKVPCKDCNKRELFCHSVCQEYIEYSEERREMLDKKLQANESWPTGRIKSQYRPIGKFNYHYTGVKERG